MENPECSDTSAVEDFVPKFRRLGEELLKRRDGLLEPVVQADMRGFSFGYEDFFADVGVGVAAFLVLLTLALLYVSVRNA